MLSKNKIKYIRSLELKKNRKEEQVFIAENGKLVEDLLGHFSCKILVATHEWFETHPKAKADEMIEVSKDELSRVSLLERFWRVCSVRSANCATVIPRRFKIMRIFSPIERFIALSPPKGLYINSCQQSIKSFQKYKKMYKLY